MKTTTDMLDIFCVTCATSQQRQAFKLRRASFSGDGLSDKFSDMTFERIRDCSCREGAFDVSSEVSR